MNNIVLKTTGLIKQYRIGSQLIDALRGIDIEVSKGEFVAIVGPSGAGKSTLLHTMGSLEKPTKGEIFVNSKALHQLDNIERAELRRNDIGFVFQFHHLLPAFSALENVMIPALINQVDRNKAIQRATKLLSDFGLEKRLDNKPSELSGGEQQRVAVARALVNSPSLLLADEPTGNLDRETGRKLEDDLVSFARSQDSSVVVVTHNEDWAARADRVLRLIDGIIVSN